jgi:hypothetical protein
MMGSPTLVGRSGDFAVLAPPTAKAALEDMLGLPKDISADMTPLRNWLGEVDAAVVGTPAGVRFVAEQAPARMIQLRGMMQIVLGQQPDALDIAGKALDALEPCVKSLADEVTHVALGVKADENLSLKVTGRVRFAAGGQWAAASKSIKSPKDGVLAGLPAGRFTTAAGLVMPQALRSGIGAVITASLKFSPGLAQLPADQQARFVQLVNDALAPVESVAIFSGVPEQGEPLSARVVMVLKVDDAAKYLDTYSTAVRQFSDALKNPATPGGIAYDVQKTDVGGCPTIDVVTDLAGFNQPAAAQVKPVFESTFGPGDKLHFYLAAADDKTVVMAYVGPDHLKRALASAKAPGGGLAADPLVGQTSALLPKGAQWMAYIQPPGPGELAPATGAPAAAPPIGLAGKIAPTGITFDIVAPPDALRAIGQTIGAMRGGQ